MDRAHQDTDLTDLSFSSSDMRSSYTSNFHSQSDSVLLLDEELKAEMEDMFAYEEELELARMLEKPHRYFSLVVSACDRCAPRSLEVPRVFQLVPRAGVLRQDYSESELQWVMEKVSPQCESCNKIARLL